MSITKKFKNWEEFLEYVTELKDWLFENDYLYKWRPNALNSYRPRRRDIMKDEKMWIEELKEKELYDQYVEYFDNCRNYLKENIVTRNNNKNRRFKEFDFSFRFKEQEADGDFSSVFVWTFINNYINKEYKFGVVPNIIYELPHNEKYFELGTCWYSKNKYSIEDIEKGTIKEYTTEDAIKKFIETIVIVTPHKESLPKLACVKMKEERSSYCGPGPVSHWDVGVSGFIVKPNKETYCITSGVLTKSSRSVNLYYDTVSYENQKEKIIKAKTKVEKIDNAIAMLGLLEEKENIKSITWFNEEGKTHIINDNGVISIYCFHKGLHDEFQSLRGNHTINRPYDPAVWGWT